MNVLQIINNDNRRLSGAVTAMHNLHRILRIQGVDSNIACGTKTTTRPEVHAISSAAPRLVRKVSSRLDRALQAVGLNNLGPINSFFLDKAAFFKNADIVHIHEIHGSMFSYLSLPKLTKHKPVIYTFHDMWAMTGHCGISNDCERWKTGCGRCPYPDGFPEIRRDNTQLEWRLKKWTFDRSNISFIAVSNWIAERFSQSFLGKHPVYFIPNGIDTHMYRPLDPAACREALSIPQTKHVLMAAAVSLAKYHRGPDLIIKALQGLPAGLKNNSCLLLMGHHGEAIGKAVDMEVRDLGFIADEQIKVAAFSAADMFIHPTRADTFSLVILESMACGTPAIAFASTGATDLVRQGQTGYLANPGNADDLCRKIVLLLEDDSQRKAMRSHCRKIAEEEYSIEKYFRRHIELYRHLLYGTPFTAPEASSPASG